MADADVRLAFALIPSEPHFSSVISASQEVTVYHDNLNVIDADRFPPHVTLHICTVPSARLPSLFERLERTATQNTAPSGPGACRADDQWRVRHAGYRADP